MPINHLLMTNCRICLCKSPCNLFIGWMTDRPVNAVIMTATWPAANQFRGVTVCVIQSTWNETNDKTVQDARTSTNQRGMTSH